MSLVMQALVRYEATQTRRTSDGVRVDNEDDWYVPQFALCDNFVDGGVLGQSTALERCGRRRVRARTTTRAGESWYVPRFVWCVIVADPWLNYSVESVSVL